MSEFDDLQDSDSDWVIETGETYVHEDHGSVEVTGIWKGVNGVDAARRTSDTGTILVRFGTNVDGKRVDELVDTLDCFTDAIE